MSGGWEARTERGLRQVGHSVYYAFLTWPRVACAWGTLNSRPVFPLYRRETEAQRGGDLFKITRRPPGHAFLAQER